MFVLSLVRAVYDDGPEALLALVLTFLTKFVVLHTIAMIEEESPRLLIFLA